MFSELNWRAVFQEHVEACERAFNMSLIVDLDIVNELESMVGRTILGYGLAKPNAAKLAGHVSFWIRKLKPISFAADSRHKYLAINELVGLWVGLSLCKRFGGQGFKMPSERIRVDWISSMRAHSHSPHGSALSFEMLFTP
ncbi:MAG: hypothetical protein HQL82_15895 [Magnetococcales bacterium]|nr:hypothetical protein [Magnetococcales bacterium]